MVEFVGAERLIAKMLVAKGERMEDAQVSIGDLNRFGVYARRLSHKTDTIFLTSRQDVRSALYDYADYFQCIYDADGKLCGVKINEQKHMSDLHRQFIDTLPTHIQSILDEALMVANRRGEDG